MRANPNQSTKVSNGTILNAITPGNHPGLTLRLG